VKVDALDAELRLLPPTRRRNIALTHLETCWLFAREAATDPEA
jgi:hypothetical protein